MKREIKAACVLVIMKVRRIKCQPNGERLHKADDTLSQTNAKRVAVHGCVDLKGLDGTMVAIGIAIGVMGILVAYLKYLRKDIQ